jgi:hypothetical protein
MRGYKRGWQVGLIGVVLFAWGGFGCYWDDGTLLSADGSAVFTNTPYVAQLVQARTFTDGTAVTTATYLDLNDGLGRRPFGIDFNADGKIDPVVGYGKDQAVIQILLSKGPTGTVEFDSLTIDSKRDMQDLSDVAVGDIDGDGRLDIIAAAEEAVWYFRQPASGPTNLREWGNQDENDALRERIAASVQILDEETLNAIIASAIGTTVNIANYDVTTESRYTDVEIGDFNNDNHEDIAATRLFHIHLEPKPNVNLDPIDIFDGNVIVFVNPGGARDGYEWSAVSAGRHERHLRLDRDGASSLMAFDLDGDGDLDLISAAQQDNNAQVAWFENPLVTGTTILVPDVAWTQWRIGSVRDARAIDVGDLNDDNRVDVVAVGGDQKQVMLFLQPTEGPKREYDWDSSPLITTETYDPRDCKIMDIDEDGVLEVVVVGTSGALRYFERPAFIGEEWTPQVITNLDPPGEVGKLGFGDLDGDGDLDLVTVVAGDDPNQSHLSWVRNEIR